MIFLPCCEACGILVPRPGFEPVPPALEVQSLNHGPPGKAWHFNNIQSSNLWTQDLFSFIYVIFHFFQQCFSVFSVEVTSLLKLVPEVFFFFFDTDWLCLQEGYTVLGICMFPLTPYNSSHLVNLKPWNVESRERIEKKIKNTQHPHGSFDILSFSIYFSILLCMFSYVHMHRSILIPVCVYIYFCKLDYSFSRLCIVLNSTYQKHLSMSQNAKWRIWQFW